MGKKTKRGLLLVVATVVLGGIWAWLDRNGNSILQWVKDSWSAIWELRNANIHLPIWALILILIVLLILAALYRLLFIGPVEVPEPAESNPVSCSGSYLNADWTWINQDGRPRELVARCSKCNTELIHRPIITPFVDRLMMPEEPPVIDSLYCGECDLTRHSEPGGDGTIRARVRRLIERDYRKSKEMMEQERNI